jgi:hypothetical protein
MVKSIRTICWLAALTSLASVASPPAPANDFWGGAAVGVGSTLLFQGVRHAYRTRQQEEQQYVYTPPPPPPVAHRSVQEQLESIKKYCDEGLFTPEECNAKRQKILDAL